MRERKVSPGGTRGSVFRVVAAERLQDAQVLMEQKRFGGAVYLAGYALECSLKWAVTRRHERIYLAAQLEVHDLEELMAKAGLDRMMHRERDLKAVYSSVTERWHPSLRYDPKVPSQREAERFYNDVQQIYYWIVDHTV